MGFCMSDRKYYIRKGNKAIGPLTCARVEELREQGILTQDSIVATSATGPWLKLEEVLLAEPGNSEVARSQAMLDSPDIDSKITEMSLNPSVSADDNARVIPPEMIQKPVSQSKKVLAPENQLTTVVSRGVIESKLGPIFLFGILVVLVFQSIQSQITKDKVEPTISDKVEPTRWEYTLESPSDVILQPSLERLGNNGWELVFARRASSELGSASYEMIFKRPKK